VQFLNIVSFDSFPLSCLVIFEVYLFVVLSDKPVEIPISVLSQKPYIRELRETAQLIYFVVNIYDLLVVE